MIGSLPHQNAEAACSLVKACLHHLPAWPQLPRRSFLENMYAQFSRGFPGAVIQEERLYIDRSQLEASLERLYASYLESRLEDYALVPDYAAGFYAFFRDGKQPVRGVKGQVTGPISWGLTVTDTKRRSLLYDEVLSDAAAKHLRLQAQWQERELRRHYGQTIIFVDEPYLSALGSAFVSLPRERVIILLEEVFQGLAGLKGVHCCGNTDWSLLLATSVDILSLDAYHYAEPLSLYPQEVKAFLKRGGAIAWGIVPNEEEALARETVASLLSRLREAMGRLVKKGVSQSLLARQCLITPSCGLAPLSLQGAQRALELTAQVSQEFRKQYLEEQP